MATLQVSRSNLSLLFGRAARVLFVISYIVGFPWGASESRRAQAMGLFGLMALFCWLFSHLYRAKRD